MIRAIICYILILASVYGASTTNVIISPDGTVQVFDNYPWEGLEVVDATDSVPIRLTPTTVYLDTALYWIDGELYMTDTNNPPSLIPFTLPDSLVVSPTTNFPVGFASFSPTVTNTAPHIYAPQISEWTRQNEPGDTMSLSAEKLSPTYAAFFVYSEASGTLQCDALSVEGQTAAIQLPLTLGTNDVSLFWAVNTNGFSYPVPINVADAWSIGFDTVVTGETFYVYGRSLSLGGESSWIYNETEDEWLESVDENPYRAEFVCPAGWALGEHTLYAHNGHGKGYGFSFPLTLTIQTGVEWTGTIYDVTDYGVIPDDGLDDSVNIQTANEVARADTGSTLFFPAGRYEMGSPLRLYQSTTYAGAGMDLTTLATWGGATNLPFLVEPASYSGTSHAILRDMELMQNEYSADTKVNILGYMSDNMYIRLRITNSENMGDRRNQGPFATEGATRLKFVDCEFLQTAEANLASVKGIRFTGCSFIGAGEDCNHYLALNGAIGLDFSSCTVSNLDMSSAASSDGWGKGRWIYANSTCADLYVGGSTCTNSGPRDPVPFYGPEAAISVSAAFDLDEYAYGFGTNYSQEIAVSYIPPEMHDMTPPGAQWAGQKLISEWVIGGVTNGGTTYIKLIDATNNVFTVWKEDWTTPYPTNWTSYSVEIKDIVDQNSGEIILYEGPTTYFTAYPTSATETNATFGNDTNLVAALSARRYLSIVQGRGVGQARKITNDPDTSGVVEIDRPWNVIPDETSVVNFGLFAYNAIVYDNLFDGRYSNVTNETSAVTALQVGGNGANIIFVGNEVRECTSAVQFKSTAQNSWDGVNYVAPTAQFGYVADNVFTNNRYAFSLYETMGTVRPTSWDGPRQLCHTARGNTVDTMSHGFFRWVSSSTTTTNAMFEGLVYQDNICSGSLDLPLDESDATNALRGTVFVGNSFSGTNAVGYSTEPGHTPVLLNNTWSGFTTDIVGIGPVLTVPQNVIKTDTNSTPVSAWLMNTGAGDLTVSHPELGTNTITQGQTLELEDVPVGNYVFTSDGGYNVLNVQSNYYAPVKALAFTEPNGASTVYEDSTNAYTLTAVYNDLSEVDLTSSATWTEDNTNTVFSGSDLIVGIMSGTQTVNVVATESGSSWTNAVTVIGTEKSGVYYSIFDGVNDYVDTAYSMDPTQDFEIEAQFAINSLGSSMVLHSQDGNSGWFLRFTTGGQSELYVGLGWLYQGGGSYSTGTVYDVRMSYVAATTTWTVESKEATSETWGTDGSGVRSMQASSGNVLIGQKGSTAYAPINLYSFDVADNGTDVRLLITDSVTETNLINTLNNDLYGNSGTGNLGFGEE